MTDKEWDMLMQTIQEIRTEQAESRKLQARVLSKVTEVTGMVPHLVTTEHCQDLRSESKNGQKTANRKFWAAILGALAAVIIALASVFTGRGGP